MAHESVVLGVGTHDLTADADQVRALVERAVPSEDLREICDEAVSSGSQASDGPYDSGITINGVGWGWFTTFPEQGRWHLVPMDIIDDSCLLFQTVSHQTQSMVGAWFRSGLLYSDPVAVGFLQPDETEPERGFLEVSYGGDLNSLASGVLGRTWDDWEPIRFCPFCDMLGWDIRVRLNPPLDLEVLLPEALFLLFEPCDDHQEGSSLSMSDRWWAFSDGVWSLTDAPNN